MSGFAEGLKAGADAASKWVKAGTDAYDIAYDYGKSSAIKEIYDNYMAKDKAIVNNEELDPITRNQQRAALREGFQDNLIRTSAILNGESAKTIIGNQDAAVESNKKFDIDLMNQLKAGKYSALLKANELVRQQGFNRVLEGLNSGKVSPMIANLMQRTGLTYDKESGQFMANGQVVPLRQVQAAYNQIPLEQLAQEGLAYEGLRSGDMSKYDAHRASNEAIATSRLNRKKVSQELENRVVQDQGISWEETPNGTVVPGSARNVQTGEAVSDAYVSRNPQTGKNGVSLEAGQNAEASDPWPEQAKKLEKALGNNYSIKRETANKGRNPVYRIKGKDGKYIKNKNGRDGFSKEELISIVEAFKKENAKDTKKSTTPNSANGNLGKVAIPTPTINRGSGGILGGVVEGVGNLRKKAVSKHRNVGAINDEYDPDRE